MQTQSTDTPLYMFWKARASQILLSGIQITMYFAIHSSTEKNINYLKALQRPNRAAGLYKNSSFPSGLEIMTNRPLSTDYDRQATTIIASMATRLIRKRSSQMGALYWSVVELAGEQSFWSSFNFKETWLKNWAFADTSQYLVADYARLITYDTQSLPGDMTTRWIKRCWLSVQYLNFIIPYRKFYQSYGQNDISQAGRICFLCFWMNGK